MCLALYLFTHDELPESQWSEANPTTWIQPTSDQDAGVREWIEGDERIYYLGSYEGCGCGWAKIDEHDEPSDREKKTQDRQKLSKLVSALESTGSWLVICWEGDQGGALLERTPLAPREIEDPDFEFEELRRYDLG